MTRNPELTRDEKHEGLMTAFAEAPDLERAQELIVWASFQDFSPIQEEEQMGAYFEVVERMRPIL
ncbi:MAG TPA: hypothetical protein VFE62_21065 [Gemmataceae bacterium]|nr:hypothetical protein [Gemmataceae bacterium]